ncbi:MAG TPA: hypothetical protein DC049_08010 [Spirochaetia bacterium]|nr:hypothetical protein [Spirochaetia bacterium]
MNNAEKDKLIEAVNRAVVTSDIKSAKRVKLEILQRRYLGGERSEDLFKAMKIETTAHHEDTKKIEA